MTSISDRAMPWANSLVPYQPGKPIAELQREQNIDKVVKLASNENPLGPSPLALAKLNKNFLETMHFYPDGSGYELKEALANYHGRDKNEFILGNGSDQIFGFVIKALVSSTDNIVVSEYGFAAYAIAAKSVGANIKIAKANGWGHDLDQMLKEIDGDTKVVFIANPNNPTGTWNTQAEFDRFMTNVPEDVLVVVDQAYFEYVKDEPDYPNAVEYISEHKNLMVTFTYSKAFGLAGLRIGYGVANANLISLFDRFRLPFNINQPAMQAAAAALEDVDHIKNSITINQQGKNQLYNAFTEIGLEYIPSMGNFVMVNIASDTGPIYEALQNKGIIVRPLKPYGIDTWLRISVGLKEQNSLLIKELSVLLGK
ncbi:MAG: histidinol-phosphate transaminase [Francisellaceae bacterium]|jgi:histidinol-phosphate aminotransferase|nr:histidinol-phosphate transaminase [Francisellaceae bacterium]MBT6206689.1 histidinol-phosphate transaminase [Francisellaceae bacterium]MBT6538770.1 histidinol-phosphate transaminase [Francisellaceae bacterium]